MRIIATCMAANEGDVIEAFVRHNLRYLDALVVLDHASLDKTGEILRHLAAEGLPLAILHDPDRAFRQGARQTQLARRYLGEHDADFCFVLDADEFIKAGTRSHLEKALAGLPADHHGLVPLQHYVSGGEKSDDPNPARRLTRRLQEQPGAARKVVVRRAFARLDRGQVSLGNHAALEVRESGVVPLPHAPLEGVCLAHFPVRSPEQIAKKALVGWLAHRLTRPEEYVPPQAGKEPAFHWHALFDRIARGEAIGEDLMAQALRAYLGDAPVAGEALVEDPLPVHYELRYVEASGGSPLATLAAWADRLVSDINEARTRSA